MVMVKQQRKNALRAHSGASWRSCSGLHARRVQGTSVPFVGVHGFSLEKVLVY